MGISLIKVSLGINSSVEYFQKLINLAVENDNSDISLSFQKCEYGGSEYAVIHINTESEKLKNELAGVPMLSLINENMKWKILSPPKQITERHNELKRKVNSGQLANLSKNLSNPHIIKIEKNKFEDEFDVTLAFEDKEQSTKIENLIKQITTPKKSPLTSHAFYSLALSIIAVIFITSC